MTTVLKEKKRLLKIYEERGMSEDKLKLLDGMFVQAARQRVELDDLWEDIQKNGRTELDFRGQVKERANSALYTTIDKSYRATIKLIETYLPAKTKPKGFGKLDEEE